jgi:hypothetical protein
MKEIESIFNTESVRVRIMPSRRADLRLAQCFCRLRRNPIQTPNHLRIRRGMTANHPPQLKRLLQLAAPRVDSTNPDQRIQRDKVRFDVARLVDGLLQMEQCLMLVAEMIMRRADIIQRNGDILTIARIVMRLQAL